MAKPSAKQQGNSSQRRKRTKTPRARISRPSAELGPLCSSPGNAQERILDTIGAQPGRVNCRMKNSKGDCSRKSHSGEFAAIRAGSIAGRYQSAEITTTASQPKTRMRGTH